MHLSSSIGISSTNCMAGSSQRTDWPPSRPSRSSVARSRLHRQ